MNEAKQFLHKALKERTASNASYSLRAFARDLAISPQQLSNVLTGRRGLGIETAARIAHKLSLSPLEKELFLESLKAEFSRSQTQKTIAKAKLQSLSAKTQLKNLQMDLFTMIANWHHFALVELIKISGKKQSSVWFAKKLNTAVSDVEECLERLEKIGLISKEEKSKKWVANQDVIIAGEGIPSEVIRRYHRQVLERAIHVLPFQAEHERYYSTSTIPIKVKDVERAKKLIQDFRLAFDNEISDSNEGEDIFALGIQFFRLTESDMKEQV